MSNVRVKMSDNSIWKKTILKNGETIYFAGYIYYKGRFYNDETVPELFESHEDIKNLVNDLNGNYALIYKFLDNVIAVADRKRSIPVFYMKDGVDYVFSDKILKPTENSLNSVAINEFLLTGYVTNDKTLLNNTYQVEAGQYVTINEGILNKTQYYFYYHKPEKMELEDSVNELEKVFHNVFNRIFNRIKDKHIMIPLSGGYDSRIIALLLKEYGIKNISSFTYGKPENPEAVKSREIAKRLGFEWNIYPYTKSEWNKLYKGEEWEKYVKYSSNFSSMAHLQDWPAVKAIVESSDVNYTFVPGHTGDFLAGDHIPYELTINKDYQKEEVVNAILNKHYRLWSMVEGKEYNKLIKEIEFSLTDLPFESSEEASALFEYWDWKERQAKFIVNSVRVYEFFGQDWEIPLWDNDLMDFFLKVPVDYRYKKYLYNTTLYKMYPDYFDKPTSNRNTQTSMKDKYGSLYKILRNIYNTKRVLEQYHKDKMEWYGITGSYVQYLSQLSFKVEKVKYKNPYNINSLLVKDYILKLKGLGK